MERKLCDTGIPNHGHGGEGRGAGSMTNMNRYVMGNKGRREWHCSYTVERSITRDVKACKNRLLWLAYAATWGHMMSGPMLMLKVLVISRSKVWPRVISGSMALLKPMFMSLACDTTECHKEVRSLGHHRRTG